jgi:cytidyltransferase-like protein
MGDVIVYGGFDDVRAPQMRFLEEAARLGPVTLLLWSDETIQAQTGKPPKFPAVERKYFLDSVRYVERVIVAEGLTGPDALPPVAGIQPAGWVIAESEMTPAKRDWSAGQDRAGNRKGLPLQAIPAARLEGFAPAPEMDLAGTPGRKKVIVTGCYDWLHSGHVRFFEEAAEYGDLYVVVGNDANVRNLKGEGHPLFPQDLRRYMAASIRFVHQALITSGWGWMDAEPEIEKLCPDIYLVNEDGDKPEKRAFCAEHGLEYVVLKRLPKEGLQRRSSTDLRGF